MLAEAIGVSIPAGHADACTARSTINSPWLPGEQMMPFLPVVRCRAWTRPSTMAVKFEHGFGHTAMIWSHNVDNMTKMGKAVNTTLFIKNGPLHGRPGLGGEGYGSFSIATPDRRRRHHPADVHAAAAVRDGRQPPHSVMSMRGVCLMVLGRVVGKAISTHKHSFAERDADARGRADSGGVARPGAVPR